MASAAEVLVVLDVEGLDVVDVDVDDVVAPLLDVVVDPPPDPDEHAASATEVANKTPPSSHLRQRLVVGLRGQPRTDGALTNRNLRA